LRFNPLISVETLPITTCLNHDPTVFEDTREAVIDVFENLRVACNGIIVADDILVVALVAMANTHHILATLAMLKNLVHADRGKPITLCKDDVADGYNKVLTSLIADVDVLTLKVIFHGFISVVSIPIIYLIKSVLSIGFPTFLCKVLDTHFGRKPRGQTAKGNRVITYVGHLDATKKNPLFRGGDNGG
jgi:hypothetical protein